MGANLVNFKQTCNLFLRKKILSVHQLPFFIFKFTG
jgi:hypothetical protein